MLEQYFSHCELGFPGRTGQAVPNLPTGRQAGEAISPVCLEIATGIRRGGRNDKKIDYI